MDLRRVPPELLLALLGAALAVALVQSLRITIRAWWSRRRLARARERGAEGEVRAEHLLRRAGFAILGRQVPSRYGVAVDGEHLPVELRADYVVAIGGRRFVAEVKTGTFAPRIETATTRRQLLEYRVAYAVDGVLLVDADAGTVRRVEFPLPAGPKPASRIAWLALGMAFGVVATLVGRGL